MLKKVILSVIALSGTILTANGNQPSVREYLIGKITKQQGKDFLVGFGIGATHGVVNQAINYVYLLNAKTNESAEGRPTLVTFATYATACKLENTYNGTDQRNSASLFGRGIGQLITESITVKPDQNGKPRVGITFEPNWSLFTAIVGS